MEIIQINVPDMPNLKALLGKSIEVPDVEASGIFAFFQKNWHWILFALIAIGVFISSINPDKPTKQERNEPLKQKNNDGQ